MKLIKDKTKNGVNLLRAEPFEQFEKDCNSCKNFWTNTVSYPSGKCNKHGFCCGYGFTCKDYE